MTKEMAVVRKGDGQECGIPIGVIDPSSVECLEDLDAAIAAYDADILKYSDRIHVAEWEECEW